MARKTSRAGRRRAPGRPPRRLAAELRRVQLAREAAPDLASRLDEFASEFPSIVARRWAERLVALHGLAADVAAWAALAAPGDAPDEVERLFAAGTVMLDAHLFSALALYESDCGDAVRAYLKRLSSRVATARDAPLAGAETDPSADAVLGRVRELAAGLRAGTATHAEAAEIASAAALAGAALVTDLLDDDEPLPPTVMSAALVYVLTGRIPALAPAWGEALVELFDVAHAELPAMLDHVRAHLAGELEHEHGDDDEPAVDRDEDGDEEDAPPLGAQLAILDDMLASVDDAAGGGQAARTLAHLLLATSLPEVFDGGLRTASRLRALAALGASRPESLDELAAGMEDFPRDGLRGYVEDAARLARAEVGPAPIAVDSVDGALTRLDELVRDVQGADDDWGLLQESQVGGLGLLGAAAEALRIAVDLGAADPPALAALACLDPLALADRLPERERAADELDRLARRIGAL